MRQPLAVALIAALALLGAVFLYVMGIDALEGRSEYQFFADSQTYHEAARGGLDHVESVADMVGIAANFLGPLLVLRLAGENYYAVLALNALLLAFSVTSLAKSLRLDATKLLLVLLINPLTISSLLSVNKEIISLVVLALIVRAYVTGSFGALLLALVTSVLVRWQLTVALIVASLLLNSLNPLRGNRRVTLLLLLGGLSVLYVQLADFLEPLRISFESAAEDYDGSGFYEKLSSLQNDGWYWAVFPAKAAHLLFGLGLRLDRIFSPTNVYNDVWQLLHSTALLLLFIALLRTRRFRLGNDLVYLSLIYIAVFAITPIYTPRYFYPVFVLWSAALCTSDRLSQVFNARRNGRGTRLVKVPFSASLSVPATAR